LGEIPVDREFARALAEETPMARLSRLGHDVAEHAIEVQLPFLQRVLPQFRLVPAAMGDQNYALCHALGTAVARLAAGGDTLLVASSDLSHYHAYDAAASLDAKTLRAIEEFDPLNLSRHFEQRRGEACGAGPMVAAMIAAKRLGATAATVLQYQNSGDTAGDRERVVGYGAVAFGNSESAVRDEEEACPLTLPERETLLKIAREAVETVVRGMRLSHGAAAVDLATFAQRRGAFVTLTKSGDLRGCIGQVAAVEPLHLTVFRVAAMAAQKDPRFRPVSIDELAELRYEISVLSPLQRVRELAEVRIGRDGLLVRRGGLEGLLLPQVAVERNWDAVAFVAQTCRKAALPRGAWRDPRTALFRFTAEVFGTGERDLTPQALG
jgi:AmmeMemoRadiSam system protein A